MTRPERRSSERNPGRAPRTPAALRPAFRLLRLVGWIVPAPRRKSWEREWRAELIHSCRRTAEPRATALTWRTLSCIPHALALRRRRWSLDMLGQDLRYAGRTLLHAPAFTSVAVLTLALAIGANVAIFSVVHSLLLEPFPVPHGDRIVYLWRGGHDRPLVTTPSPEDVAAWRDRARTLDAVEPVGHAQVTATGGPRPEELVARRISPGFLPMLGVDPSIGRNFTEAEVEAADDSVALLSHGYWMRRFGGNPDVVGEEIEIDDHVAVVVGVVPRTVGLHLFEAPDLWLPAPPTFERGTLTLGRMAPGVGIGTVREELEAIARRRAGDSEPQWIGLPRPAQEMLGSDMRAAILVLQGAVAFVLLIAGANIINLMLARGTVQRRELAIRAALGAGKARLIRQLVTETTLMSLVGGLLGLLLARGGLRLIRRLRPDSLVELDMVRFGATTVGFGLALGLGAGLLFGILPALRLARRRPGDDLQDSLERSSPASGGAVRRTLVVAEVALAFMLLVGAALMVHSFMRLQAADPGFDTEGLLTAQLQLPADHYPEAAQRKQLAEALETRLRSALGPALDDLAVASSVPGRAGILLGTVHVEGLGEPIAPGADISAAIHAGPGYFRTTGIPLLRGRGFTDEDLAAEQNIAVVSESFARTHFPDGEALGRRFGMGERFEFTARSGFQEGDAPEWLRVVGVVADAKQLGLTAGSTGDTQVYFPYRGGETLALILRLGERPLQHVETIREQIWSLDPDLPIHDLLAGRDLLDTAFESPRFQTALMSTFAGVALLLALIGVYGVLMYAVSQRVHEIGVRMALGARARDVLGLVLREGMALVGLGLLLGLLGGLGLSRYLSSLLYELEPTDPATFGLTALALAVVGLTAAALPALRASRVDPLVALRDE